MPSYSHFTLDERKMLHQLLDSGMSMRAIARELDRAPSSISREIKRNHSKKPRNPSHNLYNYHHWRANILAKIRRSALSGPRYSQDSPQLDYISEKLGLRWSPEQIHHRWKLEHPDSSLRFPSCSTIYRYIHKHLVSGATAAESLRRHGYRKYTRNSRKNNVIQPDRLITDWPEDISKRLSVGHWEGDTIRGGLNKGGLTTLVDRKTRYLTAWKIDTFNAGETKDALIASLKGLPVKSISLDNGAEFWQHHELEKALNIQVYFAHPYSPWERGLNENTNDILRFFFPKKYDFTAITNDDVQFVVDLINNRPRKCLGWKTPAEALSAELKKAML